MAVIRFHPDADGVPRACSGCKVCQSGVTRYDSYQDAIAGTKPRRKPRMTAKRKASLRAAAARDRLGTDERWHRDGRRAITSDDERTVFAVTTLESERDKPGPNAGISESMWPRKWRKASASPFTPTVLPAHIALTPPRLRESARRMTQPESDYIGTAQDDQSESARVATKGRTI